MSTDFNGLDTRLLAITAGNVHLSRLALDKDSHGLLRPWLRLGEPDFVVGGKIDGAVENRSPEEVCGVKMRVGYDDCGKPTYRVDGGDGRGVKKGYAVPEDVSTGSANKEGALADGDARLAVNDAQGGGRGMGGQGCAVVSAQGTEGGEGLASSGDVLTC